MKTTKYALAALGLIGLAMPGSSSADTLTFSLNGNPQQGDVLSLSFATSGGPPPNPTINEFKIVTPLDDPLVPVLTADARAGTPIQSVIIDVFHAVNGVPTLGETLEFDKDLVTSIALSAPGGIPLDNLTFAYATETTKVVAGGPGPTPTPEPSSLLLLASGLLALAVMTWRKKLFA